GFYFDPEQVRTSYLAAEQQGGTPPDLLQKVTREFDYTRQSVLAAAAKDDSYCTEGRTREVKAALTRQLAGDFNPPQKRQDVSVGWFEHQKREQPFNGQKVFDASQKKAGPRTSSTRSGRQAVQSKRTQHAWHRKHRLHCQLRNQCCAEQHEQKPCAEIDLREPLLSDPMTNAGGHRREKHPPHQIAGDDRGHQPQGLQRRSQI